MPEARKPHSSSTMTGAVSPGSPGHILTPESSSWVRREPAFSVDGKRGKSHSWERSQSRGPRSPPRGKQNFCRSQAVIALLNLRLGAWLPNPLLRVRREVVAMRPARPPHHTYRRAEYGRLGPGASQLLGELLGSHSRLAKRVYVTDGGHYDNLGLITLLGTRCETMRITIRSD